MYRLAHPPRYYRNNTPSQTHAPRQVLKQTGWPTYRKDVVYTRRAGGKARKVYKNKPPYRSTRRGLKKTKLPMQVITHIAKYLPGKRYGWPSQKWVRPLLSSSTRDPKAFGSSRFRMHARDAFALEEQERNLLGGLTQAEADDLFNQQFT